MPSSSYVGFLMQRVKAPGALLLFKDGRLLTCTRFVSALRLTLAESGIDPSLYAGHSFGVSAVTMTALWDLQDSLIKTLGRWNS